jgi:D-arabinose 1-dehydrogenase-like Zn-dependent alcohol dehydrogenase
MKEVLKNQQIIGAATFACTSFSLSNTFLVVGSTMGTRQDLVEATAFMTEHKIVPLVECILSGLDAAEEGFELLKSGEQFGKIVIRVVPAEKANL